MNPIEKLQENVSKVFPWVTAKLRQPKDPKTGVRWLDITYSGNMVTLNWSPVREQFELSTQQETGWGEPLEELFDVSSGAVGRRVVQIITAWTHEAIKAQSEELSSAPLDELPPEVYEARLKKWRDTETAAVKELCVKMGYGRVMQIASELWYEKDPVGALSIGPCYGTLEKDKDE